VSLFEVADLSVDITREGTARTVVRGAAFTVDEAETLALVGESGSGKTLMALGSVDLLPSGARAVSGTTRFRGVVLQDVEEADWRKLVGMGIGVLFQDAIGAWDPIELIGDQSGEALEEHQGLSGDELQRRVLDALGRVKLPKRRSFASFVHEMSRGQAQRAMLAAALLSEPRLLIADEPLSGLDVTVGRAVLDLIEDMRRERAMGMILVTHDLGVVASVADRVAVVYGGMIVEEAPAGVLYRTPRHPYTAGLLRSIPGLGPRRLEPITGESPDLWEVGGGCPFAPRCAYAVPHCSIDRPPLEPLDGSVVACWRGTELQLEGIT
jgi:oligopeptide/dipeptide ABC transporter ATP-binding protein